MTDNSPATTAGEDVLRAISKEEADIEADDASSAQRMHDGTPSSVESSPEPTGTEPPTTQDAPPPQKRKGGRKPVRVFLISPSLLWNILINPDHFIVPCFLFLSKLV